VTVFEKNDRIGGLLRYGIPDFKMEKRLIDRRLAQMHAEGVTFRTGVFVGKARPGKGVTDWAADVLAPEKLTAEFDAVVLSGGSEQPRDLPIPGRALEGVHYAMEFLPLQNKRVAGDHGVPELWATDKHVVVIGGGDTGSDCVGTSNRHGAKSVTQFELLPMPSDPENNPAWPYWPTRLRTSSSHEEGVTRDWSIATKEFVGGEGEMRGKLKAIKTVRLDWKDGKMSEVPGSESTLPADLVLLAMGFVSPVQSMLDAFGVERDARGNAKATTDGNGCYATSAPKVFTAGDMRRGQSLVVWAIREGRQCARAVDEFLMGFSELPR
jgi:glutamate synthase (NADPH/NADH) small chain